MSPGDPLFWSGKSLFNIPSPPPPKTMLEYWVFIGWMDINIVLGVGRERWTERPCVGKSVKCPKAFDQECSFCSTTSCESVLPLVLHYPESDWEHSLVVCIVQQRWSFLQNSWLFLFPVPSTLATRSVWSGQCRFWSLDFWSHNCFIKKGGVTELTLCVDIVNVRWIKNGKR